jgi:hypothetical protein
VFTRVTGLFILHFSRILGAISVEPKTMILAAPAEQDGIGVTTGTIIATVSPWNATNKTVTWSSDNEEIATVDENGKVTAVATGKAIITAKAGNKTATTEVTVKEPQDIKVAGNGFVNSNSYKGVFVEISLSGSDKGNIQSFKVDLFNEDDELIGTNTLKEAEKAHGTGLTSPFVVIPEEGGYTSQSWTTTWEDGEPRYDNPPAYALITAVDKNGVSYTAQQAYSGDWRSVWAYDIQVAGNGFVNSNSYKGVFVEISLSGSDKGNIQSFKVDLFNEDDELIGTNTLKEAEKAHGTGLTSPFVVIPEEGGYTSQSWTTTWEDGEPRYDNPPAYALITAVDKNGVSYSAEAAYTGDWASIFAVEETDNVYNIITAGQLQWLASALNDDPSSFKGKTFRLLNDIDLAGIKWVPINTWKPENHHYYIFDGNNKSIINMTVEGTSKLGFIGTNAANWKIRDLTFENPRIDGTGSFIGTVIGYQYGDVTIENVKVNGGEIATSIENKGIRIGGLVGFSVLADGAKLTLNNCQVNDVAIRGYHNVSGLVGTLLDYTSYETNWSISNCSVNKITLIFGSGNENHISPFAVDGSTFPAYAENNETFLDKGNSFVDVEIGTTQGDGSFGL